VSNPLNQTTHAAGALIGLALSGGGFRATLFGVGTLYRLNELGYLKRLDRVSSVSGGSIVAAYLGLDLQWRWCGDELRQRDRAAAQGILREVRRRSIGHQGMLTPFKTIGDAIAASYDKHLFRKPDGCSATLQDLPAEGVGPRFVICATSLQTRANVRFSRPYIADFNLGRLLDPKVKLSVAVGASIAFPPVLSPVILRTDPTLWIDAPVPAHKDLEALRSKMILTDGGVYDNIGLEAIWNK
jgi:NTE family protein